MLKRQKPNGIPENEFREKLKSLYEFLNPKWVKKQKSSNSIFTELMKREDTLASVELFVIASAVDKFRKKGLYGEWLKEYLKLIKLRKSTDIVSRTFEITSAAMFDYEGQKVTLCDTGHPGFDFNIHLGEKKINVSCKKLLVSNAEKEFTKQCDEIYEFILEKMKELQINAIQIILIHAPEKTVELTDLKLGIYRSLAHFKHYLGTDVIYELNGCIIKISKIEVDNPEYCIFPHKQSLIFLSLKEYGQEEQKRFEDLFRRAAKNVKKHSEEINENNINMIMIGLPPSISLKKAKNWLISKFENEHSSITTVLLSRTIPVYEKDLSSSFVQTEICFVPNPKAKVPIYDFMPEGKSLVAYVPYGRVTEEEAKINLVISNKTNQTLHHLEDVYMYQKGQIYHLSKKETLEYVFPRQPGIHYHCVFKLFNKQEPMILSAKYPPKEEFLIL